MNVTQYTFQSPYSSQVQVGRPDPSSQKSDASQSDGSELINSTNSSMQNAESFQTAQTQEVKPVVDTGNTLDVYA